MKKNYNDLLRFGSKKEAKKQSWHREKSRLVLGSPLYVTKIKEKEPENLREELHKIVARTSEACWAMMEISWFKEFSQFCNICSCSSSLKNGLIILASKSM